MVLITGSAPQEGKTTTLVNIAKLLAGAGEKTVVLDCDLRRAQLHQRLGLTREPGLTDYFVRHVPLEELLKVHGVAEPLRPHRGTLAPEPARAPRPPRRAGPAGRAAPRFEWILVDSPPLASVTDALLLARHADVAVMVVQHNKVDKKVVKRSVNALRKVTPNVLGAVLNQVDVQQKGYYYYYYQHDAGPGGRRPPAEKGGRGRGPERGRGSGGAPLKAMPGHWPRLVPAALLLLAAVSAPAQAPVPAPARPRSPQVLPPGTAVKKPKESRLPVARLTILGQGVERADESGVFKSVKDGDALRTGDRLRTGPGALARMQLPWMALTLGAESTLFVPPTAILGAVLQDGRAELYAEGNDLLKIRTPEGEVRGRGRLVVRRTGTTTFVMGLAGAFRFEGRGGVVLPLAQGEGLVATADGTLDGPNDLPPPPTGVHPGDDPVFVKQGQETSLRFRSTYARHHLQVLGFDSGEIVVDRDVALSPQTLRVPWIGTWRVRLSSVDERGLEGPSGATGYVVVVEE